MGAFGFFAGLPLPLSGFTLRQWMSEGGISLTGIGLTAYIGFAYTLKFLWAPLLDQVRPPGPLARFGRRRGWLLVIQPALTIACLVMAASDPVRSPVAIVAAAVALAFLSASQDIVIDAWRVETFAEETQGIALASYVWGYRIALLVAGAGAIGLADVLGWDGSFGVMAGLVALSAGATLLAPEPAVQSVDARALGFAARLRLAVVEPMAEFLQRRGSLHILAFVMLFKLGEALAHTMAVPFYRALGFDRAQVALATGVPGLIASLIGAAAGGWLLIRVGLARALILTGFVQMASMGLYFALAVSAGDSRILDRQDRARELRRSHGRRSVPDLSLVALLDRLHRDPIRPALLAGGCRAADFGRAFRAARRVAGLGTLLCVDHPGLGAGDAAHDRATSPLPGRPAAPDYRLGQGSRDSRSIAPFRSACASIHDFT